MEEYCHYETFRPECWKNEVIVIQEAIYGRRRAGRCTEAENSDMAEDPRYLGCHADVLGLLNAKCSGKKECELRIPDHDLDQATPCDKFLRMFLEVRYTCVDGAYKKLLIVFRIEKLDDIFKLLFVNFLHVNIILVIDRKENMHKGTETFVTVSNTSLRGLDI